MNKEDFIVIASSMFLVGDDSVRATGIIAMNNIGVIESKGVSLDDLEIESLEVFRFKSVHDVMEMILTLARTLSEVYAKGKCAGIMESYR